MHLPSITREKYLLRPWDAADVRSLASHANNPSIAANLRDGFPYPYSLKDARQWLKMVSENKTDMILAIEVEGEAAGGIGLHGMKDVYRYNAELGYWLSEKFWGRGIISDAVGVLVNYAFTHTRWLRVYASIYEYNTPSMRVLEKNGFIREAIHRKAVMKQGKLLDEHLFSLLRENWTGRRDKMTDHNPHVET